MNNKMVRTAVLLSLFVMIIPMISGCWSRRELNELSITVALAIDKSDGEYDLTVQLVNSGEIASKNKSGFGTPVTTYTSQGETLLEALRKLTMKLNRRIYLAQLRMVIIGEGLAKEGISPVLDFLSRNHELRTDYFIVIARDVRAEQIVKVLTPLEKIPANQLFSSLELAQKFWAATGKVTLEDLISNILSKGAKEAVLTGIRIEGDPELGSKKSAMEKVNSSPVLIYSGLAVFKKDKLIGWLNENESKGYNYTQDKVKSTVIEVKCPKGKGNLAVELIRVVAKQKGSVVEGTPHITLNLRGEVNVGDVQCDIDLTKNQTIDELEKLIEKDVKTMIEQAIRKGQTQLKSDVFGFGEAIHRSDPKYWNKVKDTWEREGYKQVEVKINPNIKIRRLGTVNNSIATELKE
ncbi:spore germination protein KC [Paenibacillus sp. yr247]|uniref:Ger(x)C family spore germination protein n=1 Tax=Paenibacillus sp. yr247 TaxID=1761880 RepID=UPI000881BA5B|nr:Ger(x)C family spore germination protein [Paenibacillus sp. yr247]SDN03698.1 spore germination protein KC [Paenibacillus sp. yr247]